MHRYCYWDDSRIFSDSVSMRINITWIEIDTKYQILLGMKYFFILLLLFIFSHINDIYLLQNLLTVCIKVMEDVRATMTKEDARDKPKIEKAMGDYCADTNGTLSAREKKICYYIDPIKRDVAQPFSLGMPAKKVCQRITKTNPEICTVRFPIKTEKMEKKDLSKMRVKQLKAILSERGVECKGCIEKEEFIKRVQETEHLAGDEF